MTTTPLTVSSEGFSLPATAAWFLAGALATFPFSASLARLTTKAGFAEVILTGMIVPCFTWVVQMLISAASLSAEKRRLYWGDLGRVCVWGSVVLWPAAVLNFAVAGAPRWPSVVNVVVSVLFMTFDLWRRSARHGIERGWAISFLVTISINMAMFYGASLLWWTP